MKGNKVVNFLAYLAIMLIAVALLLELIFGKLGLSADWVTAMNIVAQCIAYAITSVFAFMFAKSKNIGFMIAFIIAVILIIVMIIL